MKQGIIAAPGYPFLLVCGVFTFIAWLLGWRTLTLLGLAALLFLAYFFRDPERPVPQDPLAIVSPADGKVIIVDEVAESPSFHGPARRLAIFMNVFDVHVNRAPMTGRVVSATHRPGRFLAAFRAEAQDLNEQQITVLEAEDGRRLQVVQIAGLLARRIIPFTTPAAWLQKGERLGMICFGSRVDLYLPMNCQILVRKGERVKAASSIVAQWPAP